MYEAWAASRAVWRVAWVDSDVEPMVVAFVQLFTCG